jgi:hypothetical protein
MATEDDSTTAGRKFRSGRTFTLGFLALVAVATLGWFYAIARAGIAVAKWLVGY